MKRLICSCLLAVAMVASSGCCWECLYSNLYPGSWGTARHWGHGESGCAPPETGAGVAATGAVGYPYYTTRAPRDFLQDAPPSIGP